MQIIVDKLIYLWYNSSVNNILHGGVAQLGAQGTQKRTPQKLNK